MNVSGGVDVGDGGDITGDPSGVSATDPKKCLEGVHGLRVITMNATRY